MPSVCAVINPALPHQREWCTAFVAGMQAHGWWGDVVTLDDNVRAVGSDMLVVWGVHQTGIIRRARARGSKVVVIERGYIGDREKWSSVSMGGELNGRAEFPKAQDSGERFAQMADLKPWKAKGGKLAVIFGQCPGDASMTGWSLPKVYSIMAAKLRSLGWRVQYRGHPVQPTTLDGVENLDVREPIADALTRCDLAVTINSNSGVDAALSGVPVVALDRGSMAFDVASHDLGSAPQTPDRSKWAAHLAWKQWTRDEIAQGKAWAAFDQ